MFGKNCNLYLPIGAWLVIALVARAHNKLEWPKAWSHGPPLAHEGSISFRLSSNKFRKLLPFLSDAWKVIFQSLFDSSQSDFLQKSHDILIGRDGVTEKDLESLSMSWWNFHLSLLGHSQNSIMEEGLDEKRVRNSLRIAAMWTWYGWDLQSNIFFATWMESVMTTILSILSNTQAWLMPHLIANSSASVLVTKEAWWTVLIRGRLNKWMWDIDVAIVVATTRRNGTCSLLTSAKLTKGYLVVGIYKRTRQGALALFIYYIYTWLLVHATTIYVWP